jgi:hypothetical protein
MLGVDGGAATRGQCQYSGVPLRYRWPKVAEIAGGQWRFEGQGKRTSSVPLASKQLENLSSIRKIDSSYPI